MLFAGLSSFLRRNRVKVWYRRVLIVLVVVAGLVYEMRTSTLQAWLFTRYNARVSYEVAPGPSAQIRFPAGGPFDDRRGYTLIPLFQSRLESRGYQVAEQSRQSKELVRLIDRGIAPPYAEITEPGLEILGQERTVLHRYSHSDYLLQDFEGIPPLVVRTLLYLENRELDLLKPSRHNPAIEWDRLFKALLLYTGAKLGLPTSVQGGSTLAVQLEKFRHSPNGRTDSGLEKLRQVVGASLKAYREGPNTRAWKNRIVVDYLNSVPLAAAPGYGEIHGLGEGLYAWFGLRLDDVIPALTSEGTSQAKAHAFKHVLTLLTAIRAPSVFLIEDRNSLEDKVNRVARLLAQAGIIDRSLADAVKDIRIQFLPSAPLPPQPPPGRNKAANAIRTSLMELLAISNAYDLERLHLQVESTIDVPLQKKVTDFLNTLVNPEVVRAQGLDGERLLQGSDPKKVIYSLLLIERTSAGDVVRVQSDNLPRPLDFNKSVKLELGSTAKLRTLTHYLEVLAQLYGELSALEAAEREAKAREARDPITRWAAETLKQEKNLALGPFLDRALERRYSASPHEPFFTGGGLHYFENFEPQENSHIFSLREAFRRSTNLVFIRLMRDLVSFHRARLPYDPEAVLSDPNNPERERLLHEIAEEESRNTLLRAYQTYRNLSPDAVVARLLGKRADSPRHLAMLFFAWNQGASEETLAGWLKQHEKTIGAEEVSRLFRSYGSSRLNLADYGYLLSLHPLEVWCAGELTKNPGVEWKTLYSHSSEARQISSSWLLKTKNRRPQDLRLRIRIEKDAFARMTPHWQRLGFPFKNMVPSYATAIGSSSDRPTALAELMGIIINSGVRRPVTSLTKIHFARATPYETVLQPAAQPGTQILAPEVAATLKKALAEVVEKGTARRLHGAFVRPDGTVETVGGKTGSGDNRFDTFSRSGQRISSRATNRTAAFVFYIGERYFGVITAYVEGHEASQYRFTSALPVTVLKILAPTLSARLANNPDQAPAQPLDPAPTHLSPVRYLP